MTVPFEVPDYAPGSLRSIAVVLAGGAAKGAFESGVLEVLAAGGLPITRLVGTSAGALNAMALAGGIARGAPLRALRDLGAAWANDASAKLLAPRLRALFRGQGLVDARPLLELFRAHVPPVPEPVASIDVRFVVAPLSGVHVPTFWDDRGRTTYEHALSFTEADFHPDRIERVYLAVAASAALPFVFQPVELPGLGPCVDGGAVDNAPIKHALHGDRRGAAPVDTVLVVSPEPLRRVEEPESVGTLRGMALGARLADVLINERLFRDLKDAYEVNRLVAALRAEPLDDATRARLLEAFGFPGAREVRILEVRPLEALEGHLLSAFFSGELRLRYLAQGREAGHRALATLGLATAAEGSTAAGS